VLELFRDWEERINAQTKNCQALTTKALEADSEVCANAAKVEELTSMQAEIRCKQEVADHSLQLVWEQQDLLEELFAGLQDSLGVRLPGGLSLAGAATGGTDEGMSRSEHRAQALDAQLNELQQQVEQLALETDTFSTVQYKKPFDRVVHLLDAHTSELDSIQERVVAAERRLALVEASGCPVDGVLQGC